MEAMRTQRRALTLLIVIVFGVAVYEHADTLTTKVVPERASANIFNPIAVFLGIRQSSPSPPQYESLRVSQIRGTPVLPSTRIHAGAMIAGNHIPSDARGSLDSATPTLVCVPNTATKTEEVIILWACRDEASTTQGVGFETDGAVIGSTRTILNNNAVYGIECINEREDVDNTTAECMVTRAQPTLTLVAAARTVVRGGNTTVSWDTTDTTKCVLGSDRHPRFEREGRAGSASSPALLQDTTFRLVCETITGLVAEESVIVRVN